jgi:large subunit ribosomal protein L10
MATKVQKEKVVQDLKENFAKSALAVVTDYRGLSMTEMTELRKRLYKIKADYKVAKNTLIKIATKDTPFSGLESLLEGPSAVLLSSGDPSESTKTIVEFFKEIEKGDLKGGFYDGKLLSKEELKVLATLPSKEVLLGQIAGLLTANVGSIAGCLESLIRDIALLAEEVAKKNAAGTPAVAAAAVETPAVAAAAVETPAVAAAVETPAAETAAVEPEKPAQ